MIKVNRRLVYLFIIVFGLILIVRHGFSSKQTARAKPEPEKDEEEKCYYDSSCALPQMLFRIRTETENSPPFACLNDIKLFDNDNIERGLNVAVLNGSNGDILMKDTFDVKATDEKLMRWLIALPHASILVVASFGDVAEHVSREARQLLGAYGATKIDAWRGGSAYALIGQRGIEKGEAKETISALAEKSTASLFEGCFDLPLAETKIVNLTMLHKKQEAMNRADETKLAEMGAFETDLVNKQNKFKYGVKWSNCGMEQACEDDTIPIYMFSGEQKDDNPKMCIGGRMIFDKRLNEAGRGLNLAMLEPKTEKITAVAHFDTYQDESKGLEEWLDAVPTGYIVAVISFDEASNMLSEMARRIFYEMGSSMIDRLKFRASWYFVGQKGIGAYSPFEDLNVPTGNAWAQPIKTAFCLPKSLSKKPKEEASNDARNLPKRHFCAKYDRHEDFCSSKNLDEPIVPRLLSNEVRQNEPIFNVPIVVASGLAPDSLRATLQSLINQEGINTQMVLVTYDKEYAENADLAALFHVKSVAITSNGSYNVHLLQSMFSTLSIFPEADSFIVIEEDVILSDDWLQYFSSIYRAFVDDKKVDIAMAFNPNGFYDTSGSASTIYRINDQQPIGSYMVKRQLYEKHIRLREFCCLEHRNWDLRSSTVLVPALSRISITGYMLDQDNVLFSRNRIQSSTSSKLSSEYIDEISYQKYVENFVKETLTTSVDEIMNTGCEKWKNAQNQSKILKYTKNTKLEAIFECLKLYYTPKISKNNQVLRFNMRNGTIEMYLILE